MRRVPVFAVLLLALWRPAAAQEPTLQAVLGRAASYVDDFTRKISGMVAEESYVQDVEPAPGRRPPAVFHRELKSDYLLILLPGATRYVEFRDVFEVDSRRVRDRQDRLTKLFLDPKATGPRPEAILQESARYNIGRVARTLNTPLLPLQFLAADVQDAFDFKRSDDTRPATIRPAERSSAHFSVSAEVWVLDYREKGRGMFIRTPAGNLLRAEGRFWIDPQTGRVLMSELRSGDATVGATIDVSYQSEQLSGLSVPAEMRERYEVSVDGSTVTGTATYGRFRQFTVRTDENISTPQVR